MRQIAAIVAVIILLSLRVNAQESQKAITAEISISATIIQQIELITVSSMTFGRTQPGQVEIYVNPVNDINAGYMIAVGTPGAEFRLNYYPQITLTNTSGNGNLLFIYQISGNSQENQGTSQLFESENETFKFNEEGRYYIWLGGRVNLENAQPGSYEGDFTIEIDYI